MEEGVRKSGIAVVGDARWGTHFCLFYESKEDMLEILVPYFRAGLQNNELCLWVTSEPLSVREAREAMRNAVPDFDRYFKRGQIEIIPHGDWYLKDGGFNLERVLHAWVDKLNQARAQRYDGVRVTGDTAWLEKRDWRKLADYEEQVNSVVGGHPIIAICSYCLDKCGASEVVDVVSNHQFTLLRQQGKWRLVESSERRRMEEALQASERRFRQIAEASPEVLWMVSPDLSEVMYISPAYEEVWGRTCESLYKHPASWLAAVVPEDRERLAATIGEGIQGASPDAKLHSEFRITRPDGEIRWIRSSACYVRNELGEVAHLCGVAEDVTERKRAEEELRSSKEFLDNIINALDDPVFVKDRDHRWVVLNDAACKVMGHPRQELIGKSDHDVFPKGQADVFWEQDRGVLETGKTSVNEEEITWHGKFHTISTKKSVFRDSKTGNPFIAGTIRDITDRKRAEEEKRELQEQLALAQKMEALGTLAGGIAHEYNNIVAAIVGYIDLTLQTEDLSETARRNLEVVRSSGARAADLTKSLLAFSSKEVGEKKLIHLRDVVDKVLEVTAKEFTSEGIVVTVEHSTRAPQVLGSAHMLESVVMNLVVNARHAMLDSEVKKLTVQTGAERERPYIRVKDTGCGIPQNELSRIFDPFFTTKGAFATGKIYDGKARGTGLGLSVCHSIVRGHGGKIRVKSEAGKGTTFTVYLPAASRRRTTRQESEEKRKEKVPRIMVVDDEEAITDLIVDILGHAAYEADGFTSPEEAAKALGREQYAVAFVDLQMPEMNGEDFVKMVNTLPPENRPRVVILTGRPDAFGKDYGSLNVFSTLPKPFETQRVLDIVEKGLAASRRPAAGEKHRGEARGQNA